MVGIYNILVIQRISGLNLLDIAVEEMEDAKEISGMLVSGLLTSFIHFTNEVLHEDIRLMETKNFRLVFTYDEKLVFVVIMDRKGAVNVAERVLNQISKLFAKQFQEEIDTSFIGNISSFKDIAKQMEEITKLKGLKLIRQVATKKNKSRMSDFKAAFQKYMGK